MIPRRPFVAVAPACLLVISCVPAESARIHKVEPISPRVIDPRPEVAHPSSTATDVTIWARNINGSEIKLPGLPTRRGGSAHSRRKPRLATSERGFIAELPDVTDVATPAHHDGIIYAGGFGSYDFYALAASTGESIWTLRLTDDGPTAPACEDDVCVFNTFSCTVFGVDAKSGRQLWSWYLGSPQVATGGRGQWPRLLVLPWRRPS